MVRDDYSGLTANLSAASRYPRAMSRRADPARIQLARREPDRTAADYWQRGHAWIAAKVAARRMPRVPDG
jgi:hypothetical protein